MTDTQLMGLILVTLAAFIAGFGVSKWATEWQNIRRRRAWEAREWRR